MIIAELFATLGLVPDKESWDAGNQLVEKLGHAIEAYLSYEALKGVYDMFMGVAEAATHAVQQAQKFGETVEGVQELAYAAKVTDLNAGQLDGSLKRLERTLDRVAQTGKGPAADALRRLHISAAAISKLPLEQKLGIIADKFKALPDGAEKSAIALQLRIQDMIPLLNRGSDGIQQLRDEAHSFGVVIDEDTAKRFEEFHENAARVGEVFHGIKIQIAEALLPVINDLVERFLAWVDANREWIEQGVDTVVNTLITGFEYLGRGIAASIEFLRKHKEYLVALGLVIAGVLLPATISWAAATIVAIAPWLAIAAAVAAVAYWIRGFWDSADEGYTMADVWEAIKELAEQFGDWLAALPDNASQWISDTADSIKKAMSDAWDAVVKGAKAAWQAVKDTVKQAWDDIKDIPIVGQVLRGVGYLGRGAAEDITGNGITGRVRDAIISGAAFQGPRPDQLVLPVAPSIATAAGGAVTIQGGDMHFTITTGHLTPEELRDTVAGHVREAQTDAIVQAYKSLGGGKRQ